MAEQQSEMDIEALRAEFTDKANELVSKAVEFARERPHVAVGVAFGTGWVLGNGLPPRVILAVARLGWKALLGSAIAGTGLMTVLGEHEAGAGETQARRPSGPKRSGQGSRRAHATPAVEE